MKLEVADDSFRVIRGAVVGGTLHNWTKMADSQRNLDRFAWVVQTERGIQETRGKIEYERYTS